MHSISEQVRQMHRVIRQIELVVAATRAKVPAALDADLDEILQLVHEFPLHCQGAEAAGAGSAGLGGGSGSGSAGEVFAAFFHKAPSAPLEKEPSAKPPPAEAGGSPWSQQMKTLRFSSALLSGASPESYRPAIDALLISIDRLLDLGSQCTAGNELPKASGRLLDLLGQLLADLDTKPAAAAS